MNAIWAESLLRCPSFTMRVYPPLRSARDVLEQFLDRILLTQRREGCAARMNRSVLPECDHSFRERSNRLGFGKRSFDTLMFD